MSLLKLLISFPKKAKIQQYYVTFFGKFDLIRIYGKNSNIFYPSRYTATCIYNNGTCNVGEYIWKIYVNSGETLISLFLLGCFDNSSLSHISGRCCQ